MTQFLLLQASRPFPGRRHDIGFYSVAEIGSPLTEAAEALFAGSRVPVWKVAPHAEEADALAEEARDLLLDGGRFENTRLGQLLQAAMDEGASFCLFWADDFADLPQPGTREELFGLLEAQLRTDGSSNYELYARWLGDA